MPKRRLTFINRYFYPDYSATSQMLTDLAFHLAAKGWPVRVLTSRHHYDDPNAQLPATETVRGVEVVRLPSSRFGRGNLLGRLCDYISFYLSVAWACRSRLRADEVVIPATDPPMVSVVVQWFRPRRCLQVNWCHDVFPEVAMRLGVRLPLVKSLLLAVRNRSLQQASRNVVLGQMMAAQLQALGVARQQIAPIPNWCTGVQPVSAVDNELKHQWQLSQGLVVAYSGNMGRGHDLQTMIAAAHLLAERADIHFVLIGNGAQLGDLQAQAADLPQVQFQPYQARERLSESLSVADVHLLSLKPELEGFMVPSKYYGIAAVGRPAIMIGAAQGEIGRLLAEHDCGVSVSDAPALAAAICAYADQPALRQRHAENALVLHQQQLAAKHSLARWEQLFVDLQTQP